MLERAREMIDSTAVNRWTELLDRMVGGTSESQPAFITTLKFPPAKGWEQGRVWFEWEVDPAVFHPRQAVFGGYLAALADYVLGPPVWTVLHEGEAITTSNLQISFFRPVRAGRLQIESRVVNRGRRMIHVEATFTRDDGKVAAIATATQVVIPDETLDGHVG
jgi:uncharacterized protein (TIGR00369 family)